MISAFRSFNRLLRDTRDGMKWGQLFINPSILNLNDLLKSGTFEYADDSTVIVRYMFNLDRSFTNNSMGAIDRSGIHD